jgi:hypothetical protein
VTGSEDAELEAVDELDDELGKDELGSDEL